jgi:hypothetical protein
MKHRIFILFLSALLFSTFADAANEIKCTPLTVHPGEKLTIKTSKAFGDFAVDLPYKINGHNSLLLSNGDPTTDLIDSKKFMQQKGMEIDVSTETFKQKLPLFQRSGVYKFKVSTNLETDDGTPAYTCKVTFIFNEGAKSQRSTNQSEPPATPKISTHVVPPAPAKSNPVNASLDQKTLDEQFNQRVRAECGSGLGGMLCHEKFRYVFCTDKWSDTPPAGQSTCKSATPK